MVAAMTKTNVKTDRERPTGLQKPTPQKLLARILDTPELVTAVQSLEPRVLGKLINHIGLEDSSELVLLATTEQLTQIFDDDLWRSERPGQDERFDADRFALWLEVMLEAGEDFTASKLVELPEELVTLALHRHILVIDLDAMAVQMASRSDGDDLVEKALEGCLYQEFDEYRAISRRQDGWDAILSVLLALDKNHADFLRRILERCCTLSQDYMEDNGGLYSVLTAEETLDSDVAADREDRRARAGYVAPSAAAAFLRGARETDLETLKSQPRDPITKAYFRELDPTPAKRTSSAKTADATAGMWAPDRPEVFPLVEVLKDAEILHGTRAQPLLAGNTTTSASETDTPFAQALRKLFDEAPNLHAQRMMELAYLTNVLIAGCSMEGRNFRALAATRAVIATCNLGFEQLHERADILFEHGADWLFRMGWRLLHTDVSLATSRVIEQVLTAAAKDSADPTLAAQLGKVAAAVRAAAAAGRPFTTRRRLDGLDILFDASKLTAIQALLDECPSFAGDLAPTQFISTSSQLRRVASFLASISCEHRKIDGRTHR